MSNSLLQSYQINIGGEKSKLAYLIAHQILLERSLRELRQRSPLRERLLRLRSGLQRLAPPQARRIGSRTTRPPTQIKARMNNEREIGDRRHREKGKVFEPRRKDGDGAEIARLVDP